MTWALHTLQTVDPGFLGRLVPDQVLLEYDGPVVFTSQCPVGTVLVYRASDEDEGPERYIAAATNKEKLSQLTCGAVTLRDALFDGWTYALDMHYDGEVVAAWAVGSEDDLDDEYLPTSGTMLWPELQPLLRMHLDGPLFSDGSTPGEALGWAAASAPRALKRALDIVLDGDRKTRPTDEVRRMYNLPAMEMRRGSLVIGFGRPRQPQTELPGTDTLDALGKAAQLLEAGLSWLASSNDRVPTPEFAETWRAVLEATRELCPPRRGPVKTVNISGQLFRGGAVRRTGITLSQGARKRCSDEIRRLDEEGQRVLRLVGVVEELDRGRMTACLRQIEGWEKTEQQISFDEEFAEDLLDVFDEECLVEAGVQLTAGVTAGTLVSLAVVEDHDDIESDTD